MLVDLHVVELHAQRALCDPALLTSADIESLVAALSQELPPESSEDWLVLERQRWDEVRLYALEALASSLLTREQ